MLTCCTGHACCGRIEANGINSHSTQLRKKVKVKPRFHGPRLLVPCNLGSEPGALAATQQGYSLAHQLLAPSGCFQGDLVRGGIGILDVPFLQIIVNLPGCFHKGGTAPGAGRNVGHYFPLFPLKQTEEAGACDHRSAPAANLTGLNSRP